MNWRRVLPTLVEMVDPGPSITCPRCGMTSFHPTDIEQGYCGNCNWWTSDPILGRVSPDDAQ